MSSPIDLLFEDENFLIINKPGNLHSVNTRTSKNHSLANFLIEANPKQAFAAPKEEDAGLVQRLDYETSGCILAAKNKLAWEKAFLLLKSGKIFKSYLALVDKQVSKKLKIESLIAAGYRGSKKVRVFLQESDQENPKTKKIKTKFLKRSLKGQTLFSPIKYYSSSKSSLVSAIASPARRHQVRAHASFLGHPLIGDALYGSSRSLNEIFISYSGPSFFLHAYEISFINPFNNSEIFCKACVPNFCANYFKDLF